VKGGDRKGNVDVWFRAPFTQSDTTCFVAHSLSRLKEVNVFKSFSSFFK